MSKSGLPEPEYQIAVDEVKLIFRHKVTGQEAGQVTGQVTGQEAGQVTGQVMLLVSALGNDVLSLKEIMERLSLKGRDNFLTTYLNPALKEGLIEQTHPENPKHRNQNTGLQKREKLFY